MIDALFRKHGCRHAYLDVGTNIGVQIRKLFEPHKYPGAEVLPIFANLFGPQRCKVCAIGIEPNPRHTLRLNMLKRASIGSARPSSSSPNRGRDALGRAAALPRE